MIEHKKTAQLYEKLYAMQTAYNTHTNITRLSSRDDFYLKHIDDSLALLPFVDAGRDAMHCVSTGVRLIDLGTGAGYPGIPLAIERPDLHVVLNDATQKKIRYLDSVITELPLSNASAVWSRAEVLNRHYEHHEQYDFVTARAVASLKDLLILASPFLHSGGQAIFMKAKNVEAEISAAKRTAAKNNLSLLDVHKYKLADMDRAIVVYGKE
ncbi:16S rRNA methyltransferase GidB [Candidatus Termititenax dinenymphae]|uniref:Ribosomal RNA small subunit methyltransferase G n=1 Tax=Candidatus Termititenax dinenymphae TaxID=2218523 RepID=A0A388TL99_9BACT|nr:16S rRNA methyltransferase GidB [Candidatus Termititenax dinenymphae]